MAGAVAKLNPDIARACAANFAAMAAEGAERDMIVLLNTETAKRLAAEQRYLRLREDMDSILAENAGLNDRIRLLSASHRQLEMELETIRQQRAGEHRQEP